MLLSSVKFQEKAEEVVKEGLEKSPILSIVEKKLEGSGSKEEVKLEGGQENRGGMMLYTSGTTSRPVSITLFSAGTPLNRTAERSCSTGIGHDSSVSIAAESVELHSERSPPPRSPVTPYPWYNQRPDDAPFCRLDN